MRVEDDVLHELRGGEARADFLEQDFEVDHALLLFAAGCLLLKGLSTIKQHRGGYSVTRLTNNKELLMFHANAMLFNVVNSCNLKAGAQRAAGQLLQKHRVYV